MKTYTYQIGEGPGDDITKLTYSEEVQADGLGEAIDKAKAITMLRSFHAAESTVCLLDGAGTEPVWIRTVAQVRNG